jgi:glycosyltransferase involved in cell wall biosynthesis
VRFLRYGEQRDLVRRALEILPPVRRSLRAGRVVPRADGTRDRVTGYHLDMPESPAARPTGPSICLNMIVRNEAHIVREVLNAVAPYISAWVIVDTGSDDGTQDVIRHHMQGLGIPGELHEREWRNFGHNRTEALALTRGRGDYAWVIDADDIIVGTMDFRGLTADSYQLRYGSGFSYWRRQVFRDGLRWRYEGVVHEYPVCDDPATEARLEGDYHLESRRLGARNQDPKKYERDRDLLLTEVERNPADARSVFYLAQSCFDADDPAQALEWYRRRAEMGGWEEEVYYSLYRCAECQARLDEPWAIIQDYYLQAWESRSTRAEALHAIASHYRAGGQFHLGYLFAERAASIPLPESDVLFLRSDVYGWRARDEHAICAYWIGKYAESFALCRLLLAGTDLPDNERERVAANRDYAVPALIEAASSYPDEIVARLGSAARVDVAQAEVTLTLLAGGDRTQVARTLNSFLHCCVDVDRIGRFVCVDAGLSPDDRHWIAEQYPFVEFSRLGGDPGDAADVFNQMRGLIGGEYWLHGGDDWQFFAPERYVARSLALFAEEPQVAQVAFNVNYASELVDRTVVSGEVRRVRTGGRYVFYEAAPQPTTAVPAGDSPGVSVVSPLGRATTRELPAFGLAPSLIRTSLLDRVGGCDGTAAEPERDFARRYQAHGLATAFFAEVVCVRPAVTTPPATVIRTM